MPDTIQSNGNPVEQEFKLQAEDPNKSDFPRTILEFTELVIEAEDEFEVLNQVMTAVQPLRGKWPISRPL